MKCKRACMVSLAMVLASVFVLSGCSKTEDTREYVHTIGVVVTNDVDNVFEELYIYPSGEDREMGEDHIANTPQRTRVGSYGATLEVSDAYSVLVRDKRGGVYTFADITLANADECVITYDDALLMTIYHRGGGTEEVEGQYVAPGDAPDHPQSRLQKRVAYDFVIENNTSSDFTFITMREANDQDKGDVELYLETLTAGDSISVNGKLNEDDEEITEWVLYIETADSEYYISDTFNPWEADMIRISDDGDSFAYEVS